MKPEFVFIFNGNKGHFPSGVFTTKEKADAWISKYKLEGTLTQYPVDISAYDWSVDNDFFSPSKIQHRSPDFMANFSPGRYHWHYVNEDQ